MNIDSVVGMRKSSDRRLRVVLVKPSKYAEDGFVERFWRGFMPNSTLTYMYSMTSSYCQGAGLPIDLRAFDEYVQEDLGYQESFRANGAPTLVALVGVQSHQFHRALDLAALARKRGAMAVIGGPHVMTCDTSMVQGRGVSFALAEAELIWGRILEDATRGELQPVYGVEQRWQRQLESPVICPPSREDLRRYVVPMLGLYPARGCPFLCNFCSVIKIAGRNIRQQGSDVTLKSLWDAKKAGVSLVMFTSDNFNKIPGVRDLLREMIEQRLNLSFFIQCDTQIGDRDADLIPLLGQAGCFQMFIGVESFSRRALTSARKYQNHPERYAEIVRSCHEHGIRSHFSNIIGFPGDTEKDIQDHISVLSGLSPTFASFYILTPIPGTEQYEDLLTRDLIYEDNLDRFDGTRPTWHHDNLGPRQLGKLLFKCYHKFYRVRKLVRNSSRWSRPTVDSTAALLFSRINAFRRTHPMSGGVWRRRVDHADQYLDLRKETFGIGLAPLPHSLKLSPSDEAYNRTAKLV